MPRFLVTLLRSLRVYRLSDPRAVTLADGTIGEVRDLAPVSAPNAPENTPDGAPLALDVHMRQIPRQTP